LNSEIFEAIKGYDLSRIEEALPADVHLNDAKNEQGESAILLAVYYGRKKILQYLLDRRPLLDLFEASAVGDLARVEDQVRLGPDSINALTRDGWSPLHLAAFFGHKNVVECLLRHGARTDSTSNNPTANCPLHAAVVTGRTEIVEVLLREGSDVNAAAGGGWTPLLLAAGSGNEEMTKLLLEQGANRDAQNHEGETALSLAIKKNFQSIATLLRQRR
jgi:ankyrin repeat protein